ncbi:MAG: dihydrolipoyllysine-residue acetyltransferase [Halieaceae bacterium]|nr:dihydrolipoyllysine-residue acetyltransferase [Halieaceae bacterium]
MSVAPIKIPDIGGAEGAEIVEVLVAPGDAIEVEQSLIVVESDKASMEIPAPQAGVVAELRVAVGDTVSEGDVILLLEGVPESTASDDTACGEDAPAPVDDLQSGATATNAASNEQQTASTQTSTPDTMNEVTSIDVVIPDLGSDEGADLVELLVAVGAKVEEGDSLVLLESDKASMEVPSPATGILAAWLTDTGAAVTEGTVIARLEVSGTTEAPATQQLDATAADRAVGQSRAGDDSPAEAETLSTPMASPAATSDHDMIGHVDSASRSSLADAAPPQQSGSNQVYAGPAVRKLAREFGVSLSKVRGTGSRGRILKEDLQQYVAGALSDSAAAAGAGLPAIPEQDFARYGAVERVARTRIDKVTATNMVRSWLNVPHVTQFDDADISDMERFRSELKTEAADRGVRLTPLPFIFKACAVALRDHPKLKSSLADGGDTLVMKHYCHIGMAVDTPAGLIVPVIRDADKKSIWELAAEVAAVAERARNKQLKPDDMQGGVFTVSSLGAIGGRGFTPIINAPEVAILGVGRATVQPVWDGEVFRPHTLLPLALSYDHRVVNGGDGGRFLTELTSLLGDVKRMVM